MSKSVEEFSVKLLEVGGLGAALSALRLPFGKECRSSYMDVQWPKAVFCQDGICATYGGSVLVNYDDAKLVSSLVKNGDEHAKVLRGVVVWCEINAPRYWWQEMATYRVGAEGLSSESTMHIQGKGLKEEELVEMKENLTEGTMQRRVYMLSYQTLRRIYFQRRNHRLPQWRKFCKWIKSLPLADEFVTIEK